MKNKLLILLTAIMVFAVTGCGCENKTTETPENPKQEENMKEENTTPDKTIEEQVKNETKNNQDGVTLSNIKISEYGATNIITGKVKNTKSTTRNLKLTLKMYNSKTSKLLGKVNTEVKEIKSGEERNFEIKIMGDYTTVDKFEVEVKDI